MIMARRTKYDLAGFHELVQTFSEEMSLTKICEEEGIPYRRYIAWRSRMGYSTRRQSAGPDSRSLPAMVEMVAVRPQSLSTAVNVRSVRISFDNGLRLERESIGLDTLLEMLDKIRPALCLG